MNPDLRKEAFLVIARSRDAAAGALHFIESTGRWPRRVLGDPPSEPEMEAVELDALKLQRQFILRTRRKREQRSGVTVQGVTILPADLPRLLLAVLSGRTTVNWRDRRTGYVEINPTEVWTVFWLDVGWVIASALILLLAPDWFSATGDWIVAIVALMVDDFALFQYLGLRRLRTG